MAPPQAETAAHGHGDLLLPDGSWPVTQDADGGMVRSLKELRIGQPGGNGSGLAGHSLSGVVTDGTAAPV